MTTPRILITGGDGYVGTHLSNKLSNEYSTYKTSIFNKKGFIKLDICNRTEVHKIIKKLKPKIIIHTAGLSSLTECEKNPELAHKINVLGTKNIVDEIKLLKLDCNLIFLSSEYVFSGERGNYSEEDPTQPKTTYGKNKVECEEYIKENLKEYIICRSANIFGKGGNFFNFVLDNLKAKNQIEVFSDTYYTPTYIEYLTDCIPLLIEKKFFGTIHLVGQEKTSRYEFAIALAKVLGIENPKISPLTQPKEGLISKDSSLNSSKLRKLLNNYSPTINEALNFAVENHKYPYFYYSDDRGSIKGLIQDNNWKEINYVTSKKMQIRGNHYHKNATEGFFIINGKIKISLTDLVTKEKKEFFSSNGDYFFIKPMTLHTFEILEDSSWINMLSISIKGKNKDIHRLT